LAAAAALWLRSGKPTPDAAGVAAAIREALTERTVAVLLVVALITYGYVLVVALTVPQSLPDTMLYHLPRAALWKQQHA
ncbi:hypothetical protein Q8G40_30575, partial [Klebsiella pneumoniae]|uniref:hypothetical protein n=1 Tax=Klebsiella pneumoniae TaxID=573 RepID=UPI0030136A4A